MGLDFKYGSVMLKRTTVSNVMLGDIVCGYRFNIRYPSYRGVFLSCIEDFRVFIDDVEVPQKDVRFSVNGKQFLAEELGTLNKEYWFVLDDAVITVINDTGLPAGAKKLTVKMRHRVPYTGYFGQYLTLDDEQSIDL